jgi:hypothetical protein
MSVKGADRALRVELIDDLRKLDNALRCDGRKEFPVNRIPEPR